jgi:hypothetical protein
MHIKQLAQTGMAAHHRDNVMANERNPTTEPRELMVYQIRVTGHLDSEWSDWFEGLSITLEDNGETLLSGPVADQAALHGLLRKVRDLGLPLLSVIRLQPAQVDAPDVQR